MSVLVYRDGCLAVDSGCFQGDIYTGSVKKMLIIPSGLVAGVGNYDDVIQFFDWFKNNRDTEKPSLGGPFTGIYVHQSGEVLHYDNSLSPFTIQAPFIAEGSGREIALGALAKGASAREAVQITCRFCVRTREPIYWATVPFDWDKYSEDNQPPQQVITRAPWWRRWKGEA